jgi:hypothetical protein
MEESNGCSLSDFVRTQSDKDTVSKGTSGRREHEDRGDAEEVELESGVLDHVRDPLALVDRNGAVRFVNFRFSKLFGSSSPHQKSLFLKFLKLDSHSPFLDMLNTCVKTRSKTSGVFSMLGTSKRKISFFPNRNSSVWCLVDVEDECSSCNSIVKRSPEMVHAEQQLEECKAKLQEMTEVAKRLEIFCDNAPFKIGNRTKIDGRNTSNRNGGTHR